MEVLCIAIVGTFGDTIRVKKRISPRKLNIVNQGKSFGKRILANCNLIMTLSENSTFMWICPKGHQRRWPIQEVERFTLGYLNH